MSLASLHSPSALWFLVHGVPTVVGAASGIQELSYDPILAAMLRALVFLANLGGGIVVGVGTVRALLTYVRDLFVERGGEVPKEGIRLGLGRSLALALEFQLGADILGTALNPSPKDIEVLAAIVILRTALNFFLQRELREAARWEQEQGQRERGLDARPSGSA